MSINQCDQCSRLYLGPCCPECTTKGKKLCSLKVETKKEIRSESIKKDNLQEDYGVGPLEIPGIHCSNSKCKEALKKGQKPTFYVKNIEPLSVDEPFWTYYTCSNCKKSFRQTNK